VLFHEPSLNPFYFYFILCHAGDQSRCLTHARQVLYLQQPRGYF
jgi:hypothetical protein